MNGPGLKWGANVSAIVRPISLASICPNGVHLPSGEVSIKEFTQNFFTDPNVNNTTAFLCIYLDV